MWPFDRIHRRVKQFKNRPLKGNEKVAIMLLSVAPRLAATIYKHLTPNQIRELNTQMSRMVYLEDSQRIEIISKHMGIDLTPDLQARENLLAFVTAALEAYIRTDAKKAAKSFEILLDNWPRQATNFPKSDKNLSGSAQAAVLFMTLPPEVSASLFSELEPETIQKITLEITVMPTISVHTRSRVIRRFLEIETEAIPAETLRATLESVVSSNPARSAARLVETWPELDPDTKMR